ncbi:MAG: CHAD domain-containing protein [Acidimicrobiia bacterium]
MAAAASSLSLVPTEGASLADIDTLLTEQLGCGRVAAGRLARAFYDTFDHRLHRAGLVLEHEWLDGRRWLRLRRADQSTAVVQAACDRVPHRVSELADRRLRDELDGPCGERALLPVVVTDGEQYRYARTDELDKTIVRISVVTSVAVAVDRFAPPPDPGGTPADVGRARHVLDPVITLVAVRGHQRDFDALCAAVAARLGERVALDPLHRAAGAAGIALGEDPSDRAVAVRGDEPAAELAGALLRRAAEVLAANVAGIEGAVDDEFLHEFRVTLRATRALVRAGEGVLHPEDRAELLARLRALMDRTSPLRDLDVLRARWPREPEGPALIVALEALAPAYDADRAALLEVLRSPDFDELLRRLGEARPAPAAPGTAPLCSADWAAAVLPAELRRLRRRARRAGAAGTDAVAADTAELLHRARKQAKRLRYLLDVFGPLYGARAKRFRRALKDVQQQLGHFQDDCVALDALERAATGLDGADTAVLLALGRRSEQLRTARAAAVAEAVAMFAPLEAHHRRFARLLAMPTTEATEATEASGGDPP